MQQSLSMPITSNDEDVELVRAPKGTTTILVDCVPPWPLPGELNALYVPVVVDII
jgi:hypothetical protein